MRVVVQRSLEAQVVVSEQIVGKIDRGLMLLVGFTEGDDETTIDWMIDKIVHLRIFDDEQGVMNRSLLDVQGKVLSVSQFTLYADTSRGRRPSYIKALGGEQASGLYDLFNRKLSSIVPTETGKFGAEMKVTFTNDGPITILLER